VWYTCWVHPLYPSYTCAGAFTNPLPQPAFCESTLHGALPPAVCTFFRVHQSSYMQPHIRGYNVMNHRVPC
jgi:hypothetical protein